MKNGDRIEGYTLIEILVVISIIGVLSALLTGAVHNSLTSANQTSCLNNLKQAGYGVQMYVNDHEQFPSVTNVPSQNLNDLPSISEALSNYADKNVFCCPADDQGYFEKEESSYEWNTFLNGQGANPKGFHGTVLKPSQVRLLFDYLPFHGESDSPTGRNILYYDNTGNGL